MRNSFFREFIDSLKLNVVIGFPISIFCISAGFGLSDYYSNKIPDNASFDEVFDKSKDYEGQVSYDYSIIYDNDLYNTYNTLAGLFLFSPLFIAILLRLLMELKKWTLEQKMKKIKSVDGEDALAKFRDSWDYINYKKSTFYNFSSGYFIGLITLVTSVLLSFLFLILLSLLL
jgi:hypothetical protein